MACGYTRLGHKDKALDALINAMNEGFVDRSTYESESDLAPLRSEARYQQLIARLTGESKN